MFARWGNEREECVYGREERSEEKYPLTNSNIWVGELEMEWGTAVVNACSRYELPERNV